MFLKDNDPRIRAEVVRAIYDTDACDGPAGDALAALGAACADLPATVQRRIVAANYRRGKAVNAKALVAMAAAADLAPAVRTAALTALRMWATPIVTDPVIGHYRPPTTVNRDLKALATVIDDQLKALLAAPQPADRAGHDAGNERRACSISGPPRNRRQTVAVRY